MLMTFHGPAILLDYILYGNVIEYHRNVTVE